MRRREFITLLGGAATTWPLAARAEDGPVPVIGTIYSVSAAQWTDNMAGFRRGLGETGFVEGRNVAIEYRWAEGLPPSSQQRGAALCSSAGARIWRVDDCAHSITSSSINEWNRSRQHSRSNTPKRAQAVPWAK
jgi:hypothetical protein